MNEQRALALIAALAEIIRVAAGVYTEIRANHAPDAPPVERLLARADASFDAIEGAAKAELERD